MSSRSLRRAREARDKGLPEPDSDEEYQPLYAQRTAPTFSYEGLKLSSGSEAETKEPGSSSSDESAPEPAPTKNHNKKKKKKQKKVQKSIGCVGDEDEIERTVKEVNALLGTPPPAPSASAAAPKPALVPDVMLVQQKHLNVTNELRRKFGTDSEERTRRGNRQAQLRVQKRSVIVPTIDVSGFKKFGLSMSVERREGGYVYFTFDHSAEYRRRHQRMLLAVATGSLPETKLEEATRHMHIEAMLESADMLFRMEEFTAANTLIEMSIAYMQYIAHPAFQLADPQTRLSYSVAENRTFHIVILKYLYLLTNRACHRTALELAKMLMNLDPTDPLAVLLVIDTLALRAREHRWLIDAVDLWSKERAAGFLFNIQFSYALANFHVDSKKGDVTNADTLLQNAMLRFPSVPLKLLECANVQPSAHVRACPLFATAGDRITRRLKELIFLYAKLTWAKWREPDVFEWLQRNTDELAHTYDSDPEIQEGAKVLSNQQLNLFRSWPDEVVRHLCIIKPMANLLVDGAVPHVSSLISSDPAPPRRGLNRYNYSLSPEPAAPRRSAVRDLFSSLLPNIAPGDLDYRYVLDMESDNPALVLALADVAPLPDGALDEDDFELNLDGEHSDEDLDDENLLLAAVALGRTFARAITPRDGPEPPAPDPEPPAPDPDPPAPDP